MSVNENRKYLKKCKTQIGGKIKTEGKMQIADYKPFYTLKVSILHFTSGLQSATKLTDKTALYFLHVTRVRVNLLMNSFYIWVILKDLASRQSRLWDRLVMSVQYRNEIRVIEDQSGGISFQKEYIIWKRWKKNPLHPSNPRVSTKVWSCDVLVHGRAKGNLGPNVAVTSRRKNLIKIHQFHD